MNRILSAFVAVGFALLGACGDDSTDSTTTPANSAEGTVNFLVSDWLSNTPLEGATLCSSVEGIDCVTTDADGLASITGTFTSGALVQLRGDKDGYFPFLVENEIPEEIVFAEEPVTWVMADDNIVSQLVGGLEAEVDDAKGHVSMSVNMLDAYGELAPLLGATVTIDRAVEAGPNYLNAIEDFGNGIYAADPGVTAGGIVQFFNVDPGVATISIDGDYTCTTGTSGVLQEDGSVSITVEAGRVSYTSLTCTPNAAPNSADGQVNFLVTDWISGTPLEGATLCSSLEDIDCVTSDANGLASFSGTFTSGELVKLRGDKDGYFPFLVESVIPEDIEFAEEPVTWVMADDNIVSQLVAGLDSEVDDNKGHVSMFVNTLNPLGELVSLQGATVTIDSEVEAGPNYLNAIADFGNGIFTAEPGVTRGGVVQFFNVEPGVATIAIDGDYTCTTANSGFMQDSKSVKITVEAGRVSYTSLTCVPNVPNSAEGTASFVITDSITDLPIADATICPSIEGLECADTDAEGLVSFDATFTSGDIVQLRGDAEGYFPFLTESAIPQEIFFPEEPWSWAMVDNGLVGQLVTALDGTPEDDKGHLSIGVWTPGEEGNVLLAGAVTSLEGTAAIGPGYANPIEDFATGMFSEEEGTTAQGLVAYFNVDPGRVAITVEGHSCTPLLSGVNNAAGATTVTIEAGRVSYMGILCEAN